MTPKEIRSQYLGPINVTLFGKRVFAEVIKLRVSRWGNYPGFSGGP